MRLIKVALMLVPLLLALPGAAHDKEDGVTWELPCPTGPGTSNVATLGSKGLWYSVGEMDLHGDRLLVSRYDDRGFEIYSIQNPTSPSLLSYSTWYTGNTPLDVKFSADGETVFVGTFRAIEIWDVRSSYATMVASESLPITLDQGHMVHSAVIGGQEYLFVAAGFGSGVYIFEVTGSAGNRDLVRIGQFAPGSPLGAHDMYVDHDPVLGKPILYVANGFAGWIAADVSNPALPIPLAVVPNPDAGQSYVHTVLSDQIDGRRIVVTISEVGANILRVWDASILSAPVLLASWSATDPTGLGIVPSAESQHNIQLVDGRLYMAHYRCGFFVFDLNDLPTVPFTDPLDPVAHWMPARPQGQHWDIVLRNGYIYTSDMGFGTSGAFYIVEYDDISQGDTAQTSTA